MKRPSSAETAKADLNVVRTTRAFEHGEAAYGARYLQRGFARAPEDDLLFALGWPHVRYVTDDHSDDRITEPAALQKVVFRTQEGLDVARQIAVRRIRSFAASANGPDGKMRQGALRAMNNGEPMSEEDASTFVREHLAGRSLGTQQLEIVFLLEALAGPEVVAEAITTAFESTGEAHLISHAPDKSTWAFGLGFLLLRASTPVSVALRERLETVVARCAKKEVNNHSIANVLDQVLHQSKAALRGEHKDQAMLLHFVDEPAEAIRAELTPSARPFCGSVFARMVFLAGDEVIEYYKRQFDKVKEASEQRSIVAQFGRIASPQVRELIEAMSEKSKAENVASAWLDENRRSSYR